MHDSTPTGEESSGSSDEANKIDKVALSMDVSRAMDW